MKNISNKCIIYKNDLKFNEIDLQNSEFESDVIEKMYETYKKKPKIELRLDDSKSENYNYLDLSKLSLNNQIFSELLNLERIKQILSKIYFLDLSNNNFECIPNLDNFKNIKILDISFNKINSEIINDNLEELICNDNKINKINSKSLLRLNASNNFIDNLNISNIKILMVNNNKLNYLESYFNLEYLECIDNNLNKLDNMFKLEELYISDNKIENLSYLPNLKLLNCINNPIDKINYFEKLETLFISTPNISEKYNIENISKINNNYLINLKDNNI